jgi:anti-sigma-K factor RskA
MRRPPDLRELVGDELPDDELNRLERVDAVLRGVPAPPHEVPASLTQAVAAVPLGRTRPNRRRVAVALAFAAAIAALSFGLGRWTGNTFPVDYTVDMSPTASAPGSSAIVDVGERDEDSGNVELLVDVSGLPRLPEDQAYALWLRKDGEWAATCGYFSVGEGETSVRMTVSYDFREYDSWVISAGNRTTEHPALLEAEIPDA